MGIQIQKSEKIQTIHIVVIHIDFLSVMAAVINGTQRAVHVLFLSPDAC